MLFRSRQRQRQRRREGDTHISNKGDRQTEKDTYPHMTLGAPTQRERERERERERGREGE